MGRGLIPLKETAVISMQAPLPGPHQLVIPVATIGRQESSARKERGTGPSAPGTLCRNSPRPCPSWGGLRVINVLSPVAQEERQVCRDVAMFVRMTGSTSGIYNRWSCLGEPFPSGSWWSGRLFLFCLKFPQLLVSLGLMYILLEWTVTVESRRVIHPSSKMPKLWS